MKIISNLLTLSAFLLIMLGCAYRPLNLQTKSQVSYTADVYFNEQNLTLTGTLKVDIPDYGYGGKLLFNLWFNAYREGRNGGFYAPEEEDDVFYTGEEQSRGYIDIQAVTDRNGDVAFEVNNTRLLVYPEYAGLGRDYRLTIAFAARIPRIKHRIGCDGNTVWLGNWLPVLAVYENGVWFENPYYPNGDPFYSEIAAYKVTVNTPAGYIVAGSGKEAGAKVRGGRKISVITAVQIRDFSLVMSPDFVKSTLLYKDRVAVNFYAYSIGPQAVKEYLATAVRALAYYESLIGPYQYDDLDIVETDYYGDGMEYPALIWVRNIVLSDGSRDDYRISSIIVHETGHQWFYAMIGTNQVADPWIDEGFVMFYQNFFLHDRSEEWLRSEQADLERTLKQALDWENDPDIFIDMPLSEFTGPNLRRKHFRVHYYLPWLMLIDIYFIMGGDRFIEFTRGLYRRYKDKILTSAGFIRAALAFGGEGVRPVLKRYLSPQTLTQSGLF